MLIFAAEPDRRLIHVDCSLETPYGRAQSCWKYGRDRWSWKICAPCNTRVKLILPDLQVSKIMLNGKVVNDMFFELENGSYEITMELAE